MPARADATLAGIRNVGECIGTSHRVVALAVLGAHLAFAGAALAQQCVNRPVISLCGNSGRPLSGRYSGIGPFDGEFTCAPNDQVQAMFVSRDVLVTGRGPAWLAYLNAGGRIITEFSNGTAVYNEICGTAYPDGAQAGGCHDNPMPSAKLDLSHPFWLQNNIPATPAGQEGCGWNLAGSVAGEPAVTALGARAGDTAFVNFAIKPQGAGTLFLLEAD